MIFLTGRAVLTDLELRDDALVRKFFAYICIMRFQLLCRGVTRYHKSWCPLKPKNLIFNLSNYSILVKFG